MEQWAQRNARIIYAESCHRSSIAQPVALILQQLMKEFILSLGKTLVFALTSSSNLLSITFISLPLAMRSLQRIPLRPTCDIHTMVSCNPYPYSFPRSSSSLHHVLYPEGIHSSGSPHSCEQSKPIHSIYSSTLHKRLMSNASWMWHGKVVLACNNIVFVGKDNKILLTIQTFFALFSAELRRACSKAPKNSSPTKPKIASNHYGSKRLSSQLSDGAVSGKLSLLKLSRVAAEFDVVKWQWGFLT